MALQRRFSSPKKTIVIYNGIPDNQAESKKCSQLPMKIVTLSRFDYQKNMDSMFHIARHWIGNDAVRFVWVEDGEDKHRLEKLPTLKKTLQKKK